MKKTILLCMTIALFCTAGAFSADTVLQEITVKDGDTLWGVANKYLKDPQSWPDLLKYNKLLSSDPNVILPGMRLKVPILMIKEKYRSAKLIRMVNRVLYRKKDAPDWKMAELDMMLFNDDGLRTMEASIASVKFYSGETIKLEQNSLVILRPEKKHDEVELLSGAVRANHSKVISADAEIMPKISPLGENPDYKTKIKPDKTTLVEVFQGMVDVTAQGRTVTVTEGFGTEVKYLEPPSSPHKLPPQIELDEQEIIKSDRKFKIPQYSGKTASSDDSPEIINTGGADRREAKDDARVIGNMLSKYHIQLSYDKNFENILIDRVYDLGKGDIDFKKMNLRDGKYYFHVAYIDELGLEGQFSNINTMIIDTASPKIEIFDPEENEYTDREFIVIKGKTESGSKLIINDEISAIEQNGSFSRTFSAKMGKNIITVNAADAAGNTEKIKRTFYRVEKGSKKITKKKTEPAKKRKFLSFAPGSAAMGLLSITVIVGVVFLIVA